MDGWTERSRTAQRPSPDMDVPAGGVRRPEAVASPGNRPLAIEWRVIFFVKKCYNALFFPTTHLFAQVSNNARSLPENIGFAGIAARLQETVV